MKRTKKIFGTIKPKKNPMDQFKEDDKYFGTPKPKKTKPVKTPKIPAIPTVKKASVKRTK